MSSGVHCIRGGMIVARVAAAGAWVAGPAAVGVIAFTLLWPARVPSFEAVRASYVPSDAWLLDRHGVVIASRRIRYDIRRVAWVSLADVSPALVTAIVQGEARNFWHHHGIEWRSTAGAARDELIHHRRRGASTITMQLATLLRGRRAAGGVAEWLEKLGQVRVALSLERSWTKPEILEAYLNLLGYKGELQGIGAAAAQLAGKTPSGLSVPESVVLAALLPDPGAAPRRVIARACARGRGLHPAVDCSAVRVAAHEILASHAVMASDS